MPLGAASHTLREKWAWQRCQAAPGGTSPAAATSPSLASEVTIRTPERPRETRERRKSAQARPVSDSASETPMTSLRPCGASPRRPAAPRTSCGGRP